MRWLDRLVELIEDWSYLIRREGWPRALPTSGEELAHLPCRRVRFVALARSLLEPPPELQPKIALQIRDVEPGDLELVRRIDHPSEVTLCARRLAGGYEGFLALHNGQPVGHAWASKRVDPRLERVYVRLRPGDVLFADAYAAPAFRRQGVETALSVARIQRFRGLGYRRAIVFVEKHNLASLAVWQRKLGRRLLRSSTSCASVPGVGCVR